MSGKLGPVNILNFALLVPIQLRAIKSGHHVEVSIFKKLIAFLKKGASGCEDLFIIGRAEEDMPSKNFWHQ